MENFIEVIPFFILLIGFAGILAWNEITDYLWRKQFRRKD